MEYTIKAHPTTYNGVEFRSRLEATWAAWFDLMGFKWEYEPIDLQGWVPDFYVELGDRKLYVEVKPFRDIKEFSGLPVYQMQARFRNLEFPRGDTWGKYIYPATFGIDPWVSCWYDEWADGDCLDMRHSAGIDTKCPKMEELWKKAQNITRKKYF